MKRVDNALVMWGLSLFLVFGLSGCGNNDTPTGNENPVDRTPPAVASITAIDQTHVEVVFNEAVDKTSAEDVDNYAITEAIVTVNAHARAPQAPGDPLTVQTAVLDADDKTVLLGTDPMGSVPYDYEISGIEDVRGNAMTTSSSGGFDGTTEVDDTPPELVAHVPFSNATGVPLALGVTIQFSEAMDYNTVRSAFTWTGNGASVAYEMESLEPNVFTFQSNDPLASNTLYTVTVGTGAQDWAGNGLATPVTWSYRTTATVDNTPPTLVSSTPASGAVNVPVSTNFILQFSEAINQSSLNEVALTPEVGEGTATWSPDGTTITFHPDVDLADDTEYTLMIPQGSIIDLAGNGIQQSVIVQFTTGAALPTGRVSGTLSGDPGTGAANPQGAVVVVSSVFIFDDGGEGAPPIEGAAIAGVGGSYTILHIVDGEFWPVSIMDANGDGRLEPDYGDAIGAYGVDIDALDLEPSSITISGGAQVQDVDFPLFDPSAIVGNLLYDGSLYESMLYMYEYQVGLFDTTGFDPSGLIPEPDYGISGGNAAYESEFIVHQIDVGMTEGTYYVGAFIDVNYNSTYDPGVDPAGFYMSGSSLVPVTVANGDDFFGVDVHIDDPAPGAMSSPATWVTVPRGERKVRADEWHRLSDALRRAVARRN